MPEDVKSAIRKDLEREVRKRLKIPPRQPLPVAWKRRINKAADETSLALSKQYTAKQALKSGKRFFREVDYKQAVKDRLGMALDGVKLVSESDDLTQILDENAKMLFSKKEALVRAGFSEDEAFQLILAEVAAKKAR